MEPNPSTTDLAWTLGDHLGKALRLAKIKPHTMAEKLGVHPNTVGNYINDRTVPNRAVVTVWKQETGAEWLIGVYEMLTGTTSQRYSEDAGQSPIHELV